MNLYVSIKYILVYFIIISGTESSEQGNTIKKWAERIGHELNDLGILITNSEDLARRYRDNNAQVQFKDPKALLAEIKENIERMVDRKVDAVRCILKVAEEEAENFEFNANDTEYFYYNSKYSRINTDTKEMEYPPPIFRNRRMYLQMHLNNDTHFYNVPVNTTHSSVHVPLNVYDKHRDAQTTIQWSEALDEVFVQNYKSDPALSWQYFGSTTGVMRHYPAMRWKDEAIDLFDCRIRTWFIEAATCTKDVIILIDSSGSMQGYRKHIANLTISSILDTFSNNDYINVMNYSISTNYTVPCFEDILVQATKENINTFKKAVDALDPDKKSNSSIALEAAFKLLEKYRTPERCGEDNSKCNQMIMLVTDGIAGNLSSVFEKYNRFNDSIPVRIFTYLVGLEVTNVNEIMWAACTNRGYYSHVESLEEVTGSVYKYIPVIARPLVLQGVDHPVSWTHAYADTTYDDENDNVFNEPYRLLTSVAVPAFDRKVNNDNDSMTADLLGVAATDVPIDEIRKLTLPYKIGVMGYAFLISNNGYVLMHPSFRPVFNKTILKENYNSVDLMEVEQHDYNLKPRTIDPDTTVFQLRRALVNGEEGSLEDATLKYHYDNIRRITRQKYDYYYAPVNDTPFSIGLAVPHSYGSLSIVVGDKVSTLKHSHDNITAVLFKHFAGTNWRVHPKWVYCKYHYLEGHEFETPEMELLHFLGRINSSKFLDHRQYMAKSQHYHEKFKDVIVEDNDEIECGRISLGDDEYYCDRDLMHLLMFDAIITHADYDDKWKFTEANDKLLFERYNATLRFVATVSGLTRWEYIFGEDENNTKTEFGDWHSRAIDETWYKSAVLQHQYDIRSNQKSFVYSVPFDIGNQPDVLVTSSYAIFYKDGVSEAPASVVGFQFSHAQLHKRFFEITSVADANTMPCSDLLDCYVVDNSGYILVSPSFNDTGHFFGEVEGAVMESMLAENIFEKIVIYDFQGLCKEESAEFSSDVGNLLTPFDLGLKLINGFLANMLWFFMKTNLYQLWDPNFVMADDDLPYATYFTPTDSTREELDEAIVTEEFDDDDLDDDDDEDEEEVPIVYFPCDLQRDLFILNQTIFDKYNDPYQHEVPKKCSRPFFVKRIPNSNLILVAVNASHTHCDRTYTTDPIGVEYPVGVEHPCQKINLTTLPRRPLTGCYNQHEDEIYIKTCGRSNRMHFNVGIVLSALILVFWLT